MQKSKSKALNAEEKDDVFSAPDRKETAIDLPALNYAEGEATVSSASQQSDAAADAVTTIPTDDGAATETACKARKRPHKDKGKISTIGGQAVIEGVMMSGRTATALAVRSEDGELLLDTTRKRKPKTKINKVPILRGIVNFVAMLVGGMKVLMKSANVFGTDDEEMPKGFIGFSVFLGIVLAVALFIILPSLIMDGLVLLGCPDTPIVSALIEGAFRLLLFVGYLALTLALKDIRRTYMYHGAEHKTINCYEHGMDLTVENVRKSSKVHKRCGTTFLFIVLIVTILVFALSNWLTVDVFHWADAWWVRLLVRIVLLPLVAGISYEVLKFLAWLPDNWFTKALRAPGLSLQALTTREPDDSMIEVAIAAFTTVMEMDADAEKETVTFETVPIGECRKKVADILKEIDAEAAETDWILCAVLECSRGELTNRTEIKRVLNNRAIGYAKKRVKGQPLAYVLGNASFYGEEVIVTPSVLIPRPETELVAEQAILLLKEKLGSVQPGQKDQGSENPAVQTIDTASNEKADTVDKAEELTASDQSASESTVAEEKAVVKKTAKIKEILSPRRADVTALDLCTGSGCIALAIAKNTRATVTAADLSQECLNVARRNFKAEEIALIQSDLFEKIEGRFDVIVSNPPYIKTGDLASLQAEVKKEPVLALDGGDDGLDVYRAICGQVGRHLKNDGALVLELGAGQADAVKEMLPNYDCEIKKDYAGIDRILIAKRRRSKDVGQTESN